MRLTWPEYEDRPEDNYLKPDQFWAWLRTFQDVAPTQYAYALTLALTGMRPCHVRALRWDDVDFDAKVIRPRVKVYEGEVRPISRKKRAPREFPLPEVLADALRAHHAWLHSPMRHYHRGLVLQHPGAASGYCFPSAAGTPQAQGHVWRAWQEVNRRMGVDVNPRGLRRTMNNLLRLASVDSITAGELTAQTGAVRRLYSTVELNEKREAVAKVLQLVKGGGA
jgi:integrase